MKKFLGFLMLCSLIPAVAWAEPAHEGEQMVKGLAKATEEYKSIDRSTGDYDVVLRRDPMQALVDANGNIINPAGLHTGLSVQGIVRSNDFKNVLVDGEFYKEGDKIGPYTVLEIKENGFLASEEGSKKQTFVPLYS